MSERDPWDDRMDACARDDEVDSLATPAPRCATCGHERPLHTGEFGSCEWRDVDGTFCGWDGCQKFSPAAPAPETLTAFPRLPECTGRFHGACECYPVEIAALRETVERWKQAAKLAVEAGVILKSERDGMRAEIKELREEVERLNGCVAAITHEFVAAHEKVLKAEAQLADLREENRTIQQRLDACEGENDTLERVIADAPHERKCSFLWDGPRGSYREGDRPCDCWKQEKGNRK